MRFLFRFNAAWKVYISAFEVGAEWGIERQLRKADDTRGGAFPLPPSDDLPLTSTPHFQFCAGQDMAGLHDLSDKITKGDRSATDVDTFGGYLFDTLIGASTWTKILRTVSEKSAAEIELALSWSAAEKHLTRLNWKMMKFPSDSLVSVRPVEIAITRVVMRFLFRINTAWTVNISAFELGPAWSIERQLRKAKDVRGGIFPLPPSDDLPQNTALHFGLCAGQDMAGLCDLYDRITKRDPRPGDVDSFGGYLFDTLIGADAWTRILEAVNERSATEIELALSWPATEMYLHRLNWEMMKGPRDFLASGRAIEIAMTRIVASSGHSATPINLPPRVLFVIGTSLYDPNIQAGAETLGLMRQFKHMDRTIHSRILQLASPAKIKAAMSSFRPDVVYFICHGDVKRPEGRGYLILRKDDEQQDDDEPRYASQLLDYLRVEGKYPPIVVLSACYSAGVNQRMLLGAHDSAPLAAEMVSGGIPIVIGMAGRVSDPACRLFTRRFGEALLGGESLVVATAEGRRAAFAEGAPPHKSVDWALPAVFIAEGVEPGYVPARLSEDDRATRIEKWIKSYAIQRTPVFCARDEFFHAYYELFDPRGRPVLGAFADQPTRGLGRTRLLEELSIEAIRDGHVPCLVSSPSPAWSIPTNAAQLGMELLDGIVDARRAFGLKPPLESVILQTALRKKRHSDADALQELYADQPDVLFENLREHLTRMEDVISVELLKVALQKDLAQLLAELDAKFPSPVGFRRQAIVLLDEVDQYGEALTTALFHKLLGPYGLGTAEQPLPVVVVFSLSKAPLEIMRPIKESPPPWLRLLPLEAFHEGPEEARAYERVWLHPFNARLPTPLVLNSAATEENIRKFLIRLRDSLDGVPANLSRDTFFALAAMAKDFDLLVLADDQKRLEDMRKERTRDM
jgi:CHAT domain